MKKIVVFTGAGVSAESGLATFRDSDGLWAQYKIEDVCTPEALERNRALVIEFYNKRRRELLSTLPNAAHEAIARLEELFDVEVITQNVDDLHERAGSRKVIHLHGELKKLRSQINPDIIVPIDDWEQKIDDRAEDGSLLRPHIVFFGESVPMYDKAVKVISNADIVIVIGTSLAVYPAAGLLRYAQQNVPIFLIDPGEPDCSAIKNSIYHIKEKAGKGMPMLAEKLIDNLKN